MKQISLKQDVLQGNRKAAALNRQLFQEYHILSLNLMSSPGAGKTTFLETFLRHLQGKMKIGVIEGDVATTLDAERIAACGAEVVQINTHGACHLDAAMISRVMGHFDLDQLDLLIIENVGNLVCPAEFDLGERLRIALLSTTEGADKVVKYPAVFQSADAVFLNKIDLIRYVRFDLSAFHESIHRLNPMVPVFPVSALTGEGMEQWIKWLMARQSE